MNEGKRGLGLGVVHRVSVMGVLVLVAGCHSRQQSGDLTLLERVSRVGHSRVTDPKPGELAEKGRAAITDECAKQSYETASKGLIVSKTGLHEDVFALRDRVSYGAIGYGLDEALRLGSLLRLEANGLGHPTEQADCIRQFAEHLETLTDPLVEADERQKEMNVSAFNDSTKEAEELEKKLRETEKLAEPKLQPSEPLPKNY